MLSNEAEASRYSEKPQSRGHAIYHHYAGQSGMYASFIDRPLDDERVIIARTFSKVYGLAGLRLGYAVASPKTIQQMRKFATEDNINAIVTKALGPRSTIPTQSMTSFSVIGTTVRNFSIRPWLVRLGRSIRTPTL